MTDHDVSERKYVIPLLFGPEHQHCQDGSYEVLVMPFIGVRKENPRSSWLTETCVSR